MANDDDLIKILEAYQKYGSRRMASKHLGIPDTTFRRRLNLAIKIYGSEEMTRRPKPAEYKEAFELDQLPPSDVPFEERLKQRLAAFEARKKYEMAAKIRVAKVNIDGPIGILHFGDPHVDDDGTDLSLLYQHVDLVNGTDG